MKVFSKKKGIKARERSKRMKIRLFVLSFLLIVFISLFVWIVRRPFMKIDDIAVIGLETLNPDLIIEKTRENISGDRLFLIPKDNILFFPEAEIFEDLYSIDHRLKNIEIKIDHKKTMQIKIEEYNPTFSYCSENCYYATNEGYIFRRVDFNPLGLYVVFENGIEGEPLGKYFAKDYISRISKILDFFESKNIKIQKVKYAGNVDYYFYTDNNIEFRIDFDGDIEKLKEYLDIFINQNRQMIDEAGLEYVDMRFGKKIFYVEKGSDKELESVD